MFFLGSLLLAGTVAIDMSGDTLWKMHNTGVCKCGPPPPPPKWRKKGKTISFACFV